ncbi:DUF4287 domain-containing protein [Phytoactinopolyspora halotolerans]|uniref:DUF4287 domain-containing protein n=1 Tax=Phytoactinopolyspora halotolerans TaxID=1981512 RepID=A0A6L9SI48_9ACTN|nr:DUF4287 domain-containing protein [Phytoactinopolyspora halotolerans]NEE03740.1 DUF4287 domain-containing protein [Phytoactinopolyspora halotolerans]
MTKQKSFKTRVRTRMEKTGESYAAARRQLLSKNDEAPSEPAAEVAPPEQNGAVRALQQSEQSALERTGRGWDQWFALLDEWNATARAHAEIARWLIEDHDVPGWWAQSITVAYEQARGMRAPGQRSNGTFSATASKTVGVPVERLFDAFNDAVLREKWLPGAALHVRTATAPKTFRADWADDGTRIVAGFTAKGDAKSSVGLEHEKLPDAEAAAEMKAYWRDHFGALKQLLEA